ncbi:MAG: hypothetical protein K2O10_04495, partial [Muribaculaceae bacterium]|nr:hypothetical protein [Muribaculaceae bacterium]
RPTRRTVTFVTGAPPAEQPTWTIANGPLAGHSLSDPRIAAAETRAEGASTVYWLRPEALVAQDSLLIAARYQKTDSADRLVWQNDTLKLFFREFKSKKQRQAEENDTTPPQPVFMSLALETKGSQDLDKPLLFTASEPLDTILPQAIRLEMTTDSIWEPVTTGTFVRDSLSPRQWTLPVKWLEDTRYRLTADSLGVTNIYGEPIKGFVNEFKTKKMSEYGSVALTITDLPADSTGTLPVIVELLDSKDSPVKASPVVAGTATFGYLAPGPYYARAYIDLNDNGVWDTGNIAEKLLPEEVFYYPKKLNVRANWDVNQSWAMFEMPVDMQKPYDIKKNKPKTKEYQPQQSDDPDEEDDEFSNSNAWDNGSQRNSGRGNNRITPTGGMQTVKTRR